MKDGNESSGLWISLDIETHGAVQEDSEGRPSPTQMEKKGNGRFHPAKTITFDNPKELIATCSITLLKPASTDTIPSVSSLASMTLLDTRVFLLHRPQHTLWLTQWIRRSALIVGHNIQFDLMYLRAHSPELSEALNGDQLLIDTGILNYMESEVREEKSLKQLSPLFNRMDYDETASNTRFKNAEDPLLIKYNAQDTEYTAHLAKTLCRRISAKFPDSKKLEPEALRFYSEDLWTCIAKSEAGVPFRVDLLMKMHRTLARKCEIMAGLIESKAQRLGCNLRLSGAGSQKTQEEFVDHLLVACNMTGHEPPILMNDRLARTDKKQAIKFDKGNIALFLEYLGGTQEGEILTLYLKYEKYRKLMSSYTQSMLFHKSNDSKNQNNKLIGEYTWKIEPSNCSEIEPPPFTPTSYGTVARSRTTERSPKNCSVSTTSSEDCTPAPHTGCSSCSQPTSTAGTNSSSCSPRRARRSKSSARSNPSGKHPYWSPLKVQSKRKIRKEFNQWRSSSSSSSSWSSLSVPTETKIKIAYPHWYPVPQSVTDSDENIGGTEQGRTTAKQPALQTLPYSIKKLACSRFEGGSFMAYDLSQIELRIAAISSGEPTMVEEYHKPEPDLHTSMAVGIWGPDVLNEPGFRSGDNTKDKRQWAKEPNFLIQYWGGAFSLYTRLSAKGVDTTLEECEEIINRVVKARPVLREWQISLLKFAEKHGYVEACPVYGTTRTMIGDVYGSLRSTVVNCPIQTRAGHTLRAIEHYLFRKFDSLHTIRSLRNRRHLLCQQVYDAVYVDTTDPEEATGLVMEATKWVEQHGYYAKLCDITGHFVPLVMEAA